MRILAGILATLLTSVVAAAGSAPAAAPRLALVTCDDAGGSVAQPGRRLYSSRLALSWDTKARKLSPFRNVGFPYSSSLPLFIRAGGRAFTIEIAATWHGSRGHGVGQTR